MGGVPGRVSSALYIRSYIRVVRDAGRLMCRGSEGRQHQVLVINESVRTVDTRIERRDMHSVIHAQHARTAKQNT